MNKLIGIVYSDKEQQSRSVKFFNRLMKDTNPSVILIYRNTWHASGSTGDATLVARMETTYE